MVDTELTIARRIEKRIETCVGFLVLVMILAVVNIMLTVAAYTAVDHVGQQVQTLTAMHGAMGGE